MSISIKSIGCHVGCVGIKGGEHNSEVTRADNNRWLAECSDCGAVLRGFPSIGQAMTLAIQHAVDKTVIS